MTDKYDVQFARHISRAAHKDQVDKSGEPYWEHPERVAKRMKRRDYEGKVVALLHDVIEDTDGATRDFYRNLIGLSFDPVIAHAVEALTHRKNEPRKDYYLRILAFGDLALRVKLADIADNTDPTRLQGLDQETRDRLTVKYREAKEALNV